MLSALWDKQTPASQTFPISIHERWRPCTSAYLQLFLFYFIHFLPVLYITILRSSSCSRPADLLRPGNSGASQNSSASWEIQTNWRGRLGGEEEEEEMLRINNNSTRGSSIQCQHSHPFNMLNDSFVSFFFSIYFWKKKSNWFLFGKKGAIVLILKIIYKPVKCAEREATVS